MLAKSVICFGKLIFTHQKAELWHLIARDDGDKSNREFCCVGIKIETSKPHHYYGNENIFQFTNFYSTVIISLGEFFKC